MFEGAYATVLNTVDVYLTVLSCVLTPLPGPERSQSVVAGRLPGQRPLLVCVAAACARWEGGRGRGENNVIRRLYFCRSLSFSVAYMKTKKWRKK